jgi:hypothetical protein
MNLTLNDEQRRAVAESADRPLTLVGEGGRDYVLLSLSEYDRIVAESANRRDIAGTHLGDATSSVRREIVPSSATVRPENPWGNLPLRPRYVLPTDDEQITRFNQKAITKFRVETGALPEPFLGAIDAPVVLLNLNPGFGKQDLKRHAEPLFIKRSRANLTHEPAEYPFYLLDPDPNLHRGQWWDRKLKCLIKEVGLESVARRVMCVEYFPYHSRRFRHRKIALDSQRYSFWLVHQALERKAVILLLRGKKAWLAKIPELKGNVFLAKNPRAASVSPKNFPQGFSEAVEALKDETRKDVQAC